MSQFRIALQGVVSAPAPVGAEEIIEELRELEILKCAAEARQARLTSALDEIRTREAKAAGASGGASTSTAAEVALARRISPHRGRRLLSLARHLARELPHTKAAFDSGRISEWRATIIARESACLEAAHRAEVDEAIAADGDELARHSDRRTAALVRQHAARLDAASMAKRRRRAESERRVTLRPAPDSMVYLTALLPVAQGVGVYAALREWAVSAVGTGAASGIGVGMADELVRRITGTGTAQPVTLRLTMSGDALFAGADDPAFLSGAAGAGHQDLPAEAARALVADNLAAGTKLWLKRLFVKPESGELVALDSRARLFPKALGEFLDLRDRWCRTPWCDAPIRHHDHAERHADGGPTSAANGQGLCEACSYAKESPGWAAREGPGEPHAVVTTTPTGHQYRSRAPAA